MAYYIRKNGVTKKLAVIPDGYPAELIGYYNTGTNLQSDNAQDAITELDSGKVSKSGDTMSGKLTVDEADGTSSTLGWSEFVVGNDKTEGTEGNTQGIIRIYSNTAYRVSLLADNISANRAIYFPNKGGTIALQGDVVAKTGDTMSGDLIVDLQNGTTSDIGYSLTKLGNNIAEGTNKNSTGMLVLYGRGQYYGRFYDANNVLTANRSYYLPNKNGTIALTNDLGSQIENINFSGTNTGKKITFSGNAHTRVANLILIPSGQAAIGEVIAVGFSGQSGYKAIEGVFVSPNNYGVTVSGLSITIPRGSSAWGVHTMIKLFPEDELTYTIEDV